MAQWKNIRISQNFIKASTNKAHLISMPHSSDYDGYVFWHTLKLFSEYGESTVSLIYNDSFKFHLKKYGKGRYNSRQIIDEVEIGVEEFEKAFENAAFGKYPLIHKPQLLEVEPVEVLEELKDE